MTGEMIVIPILGVPAVNPGDDVAHMLIDAIARGGLQLRSHDIVVVTHKIISKAEGRVAEIVDDAAYRRLVDQEAAAVIRRRGDLVIARTRHGFICANAGVDRSNTEPGTAVLLPIDPDRSAHRLRTLLERRSSQRLGVVISDTFGRPWRRGLVDVAIGVSGLRAIVDLRGSTDGWGRRLDNTEPAVGDELAAAADLVMGKADRIPAAIIRGLRLDGAGRAADLVRGAEEDLFR
jgi:coenzyme F420-0:L-glutamate ligase/coenzyme F420-1:gamma-L-glutamate ligase